MVDKPILFSAPMIKALLAGTKTQTRRKLDAWTEEPVAFIEAGAITALDENESEYRWPRTHAVGDRLYVREHWRVAPLHNDVRAGEVQRHVPIHYVADGGRTNSLPMLHAMGGRFRQGMHMPRWASRLTLTVTDVRVERLQDVSDRGAQNDCTAEGVFHCGMTVPSYEEWHSSGLRSSEKFMYRQLWEAINGPGSWQANPWVAAYSFRVHHGNIDQMGGE